LKFLAIAEKNAKKSQVDTFCRTLYIGNFNDAGVSGPALCLPRNRLEVMYVHNLQSSY